MRSARARKGNKVWTVLVLGVGLLLTACSGITLRSPITIGYGDDDFVVCDDKGCTVTVPQQQHYIPYQRKTYEPVK